jgi:6-phosphogluconate dehydrogenase
MKCLVIGLGRMGGGMIRRLNSKGHRAAGYDKDPKARDLLKGMAHILEDLSQLEDFFGTQRKFVWLMVPHEVVDQVLDELTPFLSKGDVVVDGGNSYYRDSQIRHRRLKERGVYFLDVGVSGGIYGEQVGYCLMVGGDREAFEFIEEALKDLSYEGRGYAYLGVSGAGHFAKMVHNGIEYAIMQAIGEGFELLKESEFGYDLSQVARIYNAGSVIRSWLMELTQKVFEEFGDLEGLKAYVEDTGEGRWTLLEAIQRGVPVPTIGDALFMRFRSRQENSFRDRLLAGLRYQFGRHQIRRKDE